MTSTSLISVPLFALNPPSCPQSSALDLPSNTYCTGLNKTVQIRIPIQDLNDLNALILEGRYIIAPTSPPPDGDNVLFKDQAMYFTQYVVPWAGMSHFGALINTLRVQSTSGTVILYKRDLATTFQQCSERHMGEQHVFVNFGNWVKFNAYYSPPNPAGATLLQCSIPFYFNLTAFLNENLPPSVTGSLLIEIEWNNPSESMQYVRVFSPQPIQPLASSFGSITPSTCLSISANVSTQHNCPAPQNGNPAVFATASKGLSQLSYTDMPRGSTVPYTVDISHGLSAIVNVALTNLSFYITCSFRAFYAINQERQTSFTIQQYVDINMEIPVNIGNTQNFNAPLVNESIGNIVIRKVDRQSVLNAAVSIKQNVSAYSTAIYWTFNQQNPFSPYPVQSFTPLTEISVTQSTLSRAQSLTQGLELINMIRTQEGMGSSFTFGLAKFFSSAQFNIREFSGNQGLWMPLNWMSAAYGLSPVNASNNTMRFAAYESIRYDPADNLVYIIPDGFIASNWQGFSRITDPIVYRPLLAPPAQRNGNLFMLRWHPSYSTTSYTYSPTLTAAYVGNRPLNGSAYLWSFLTKATWITGINNHFSTTSIFDLNGAAINERGNWVYSTDTFYDATRNSLCIMGSASALPWHTYRTGEYAKDNLIHRITKNEYRQIMVTPTGVTVVPGSDHVEDTTNLYHFRFGGLEHVTGMSYLRQMPVVTCPPRIQGNRAFRAFLPEAGNVISAYFQLGVVPRGLVQVVDGQIQQPIYSPVGPVNSLLNVAANRYRLGTTGYVGMVDSVQITDPKTTLLDNFTLPAMELELLQRTTDEATIQRRANRSGTIYAVRSPCYGWSHMMDTCRRLDTHAGCESLVNFHCPIRPWSPFTNASDYTNSPSFVPRDQINWQVWGSDRDTYAQSDCDMLQLPLASTSTALQQILQYPMIPDRNVTIEFDQDFCHGFTCSAGGAAFERNNYDPVTEFRFRSATAWGGYVNVNLTNQTSQEFTAMLDPSDPSIQLVHSGIQRLTTLAGGVQSCSMPKIKFLPQNLDYGSSSKYPFRLFARMAVAPDQDNVTAEFYRLSPPTMQTPIVTSFTTNLTVKPTPNWGDSNAVDIGAAAAYTIEGDPLAYQRYTILSRAEECLKKVVAGNYDPTRQERYVPNFICPRLAYGRGVSYSVALLDLQANDTFNAKYKLMNPQAFTTGLYCQPQADDTLLRSVYPYFGTPLENRLQYASMTGRTLMIPGEAHFSMYGPYLDTLFPTFLDGTALYLSYDANLKGRTSAYRLHHYSTVQAQQSYDSPDLAGVRSCVGRYPATEAIMAQQTRFPSADDYFFLNLTGLTGGRQVLTFNWQIGSSAASPFPKRHFIGYSNTRLSGLQISDELTLQKMLPAPNVESALYPWMIANSFATLGTYTTIISFFATSTWSFSPEGHLILLNAGF
jgi:hypothetical protein